MLASYSYGLVTNFREGGPKKREGTGGGHVKCYPYKKRGLKKFQPFSSGGTTSFGVVFNLKVLAILKGA